jgi:Mini-chromosome maintenance protein 2
LDRYENEGLDDEEQKELDFQTRREAERELNQRERLMNRGGRRIPGALMDEELNEYSEEGLLNKQMREERMRMLHDGVLAMEDEDD